MRKTILSKIPAGSLKSFILKIAFLSVCMIMFGVLGHYISRNAEYEYTGTNKDPVLSHGISSQSTAEREPSFYTLVLENGELVTYAPDGTRSYTGVDVGALTDYDTQLLSEGICAEKEELYEIIEGLMS